LLSGCSYWPSAPHNGALFTEVTSAIAMLDQGDQAVSTGEACSTSILGLFAKGDFSISAAKANAGITKVSTVEERYLHYVLGVYSKYCTVVSGS